MTVLDSQSDALVMTAASLTSSPVVSWTPPPLATSTFTSCHSRWTPLLTISLRCALLVHHQQAQGRAPALPSQSSSIPDSSSQTMALHQLCKFDFVIRFQKLSNPLMRNIDCNVYRSIDTIIVLFKRKDPFFKQLLKHEISKCKV